MINRLLSIIYILMNKGTVTAKELAERFEVSVRTIYRDVETLSMAGIPVYTAKGRNGGIRLTEQFVLNKMLVSKKEQQQILAALASLKETGVHEEAEILEKLSDFFMEKPENWVAVDFSDWSGRRKELFNQIRDAILNRHVLQFDYYGQYGDMSSRTVEPVQLLFKEYTWYVRAFCRTRQDMRLFKALRMKRVAVLDEVFEAGKDGAYAEDERYAESISVSGNADDTTGNDTAACGTGKGGSAENSSIRSSSAPAPVETLLWIDKKEAYRVYDRFDEEEITVLPDGHFHVRINYLLDDWTYGMILSFGASAKVLGPEEVRREIRRRIGEMKRLYE